MTVFMCIVQTFLALLLLRSFALTLHNLNGKGYHGITLLSRLASSTFGLLSFNMGVSLFMFFFTGSGMTAGVANMFSSIVLLLFGNAWFRYWYEEGPFQPLHRLNKSIRDRAKSLTAWL